jgi:hypothetical protein
MATTNRSIFTEPSKTTRRRVVLAIAIEQLATNPLRRAEMGEACRARIEQRFNWQKKARHITKLYEGLAQRAPLNFHHQSESAIDLKSYQKQFAGEQQ